VADGISFDLLTGPFKEWKAELDLTTRRTTMYALRETGRKIAARGRAAAPVYPGPMNQSSATDARAKKGALKKSIHNSKTVKQSGDTFVLAVGPMGAVTPYRSKVEGQYGYMRGAFSNADIGAEYESALADAYARYR
jgi:hypothetical protein